MEIAIHAARSLCDLPIVASLTFAQDGYTTDGFTPADAALRLMEAGADVIGANYR